MLYKYTNLYSLIGMKFHQIYKFVVNLSNLEMNKKDKNHYRNNYKNQAIN